MELIIIWLLFGVACYLLAEKKNRNPWLAGAMGALFGVFALIYYIAVGPDTTKPNNNTNTPTTQS